jgi:hypothetical protein
MLVQILRKINIFECLSTVKYFHKISLKHGTVLDIP